MANLSRRRWQENQLNLYDSSSYHVTLYLANKIVIQREGYQYRNNGYIIAESGATSKFILDNLEIASPIGASSLVTNVASQLTWTITEPLGGAFFPAALAACAKLKIRTILEAGFVMEIKFTGRNARGEPVHPLAGNTWVFPLVVLDISAKHDASGSIYNFTAIKTSQTANTETHNVAKHQISFDASKLGEAMDKLTAELNKIYKDVANTAGYTNRADDAIINLPAEWREWSIVSSSQQESTITPGSRTFTLDAGGNVKDFIDKIMHNTVEIMQAMQLAGIRLQLQPPDASKTVIDPYFKITTDVEYDALFDTVRHEHPRTITYDIIPFRENPRTDQERYEQFVKDKELQRAKVKDLIDNNLLKKRYDYLYTGLNTEVLNFDITLNTAFKEAQLIYLGSTAFPNNTLPATSPEAPLPSEDSDAFFDAQVNEAQKAVADARREVTASEEAYNDAMSDRLDPPELAAAEQRVADAKASQRTALERISELEAQAQTRAISAGDSITNKYLGSITEATVDALVRRYEPKFVARNDANEMSALLALARNRQGQPAELLNLELEIRGDPYWLGLPEEAKYDREEIPPSNPFSGNRPSEQELNEQFDYDIGPPFFLFSQFFPREHDSQGLMKSYYNPLYSGVFQAMTVIHSFRGGGFTQFLTAIRDTEIQDELVLQLINNDFDPRSPDDNVELPGDDGDYGPEISEADPDDVSSTSIPAPTVPPDATVSEREQIAVNWYMSEEGGGYTRAQASGLAAQFTAESNYDPNAVNPGDGRDSANYTLSDGHVYNGTDSVGIGQWNGQRARNLYAYSEARGDPIEYETINGKKYRKVPLETQLAFSSHELNGSGAHGGGSESTANNKIRNASTPQEAAAAAAWYERFGGGPMQDDGYKLNDYRRGMKSPYTQKRAGYASRIFGGG